MHPRSTTVEEIIRRIADHAHGVVTRRELLTAGVTRDEIRGRVRKGWLLPVYPGVYRVGHTAPGMEPSYMAAVKAGREGALLSGFAAAYFLRLLKGEVPAPEITAPAKRKVPGLITHRGRPRGEVVRGIPVTTVPQTLVDLAPRVGIEQLARLCHEAGVLHGTTPRDVAAVLRPNSPGAANLRTVMEGGSPVTLSRLERRFLQLLRAHKLPLPDTNKVAGEHRVDCRWPGHRLTVELDSYRFHNSRYSWQQGYLRERAAYARQDRYRRYTYADVFEDPTAMLAELGDLLTSNA